MFNYFNIHDVNRRNVRSIPSPLYKSGDIVYNSINKSFIAHMENLLTAKLKN